MDLLVWICGVEGGVTGEKKNPTVSGFVKEKINCKKLCEHLGLYTNASVCQEFHEISKDQAVGRWKQNQEWGTTFGPNSVSNPNNKIKSLNS